VADSFSSDDCRGIDARVSDQLIGVVFLYYYRVNGIRNSFIDKHFERSGKRRLGRTISAIFPTAKFSQTRICIQIFNQSLRRRKVVKCFQEKRQKYFLAVLHRSASLLQRNARVMNRDGRTTTTRKNALLFAVNSPNEKD